MQNEYSSNQTWAYLAHRIDSASPEELAAMLLEGAQRFLLQAVAAIRRRDYREKGRLLHRVSLIMQRLLGMLNPEGDEALVKRLHGIYIWWIKEMFEGSMKDEPEKIEQVVQQMGTVRSGWMELNSKGSCLQPPTQFSLEGMVG